MNNTDAMSRGDVCPAHPARYLLGDAVLLVMTEFLLARSAWFSAPLFEANAIMASRTGLSLAWLECGDQDHWVLQLADLHDPEEPVATASVSLSVLRGFCLLDVQRLSANLWIATDGFRGVCHVDGSVDGGGILRGSPLYYTDAMRTTRYGPWVAGRAKNDRLTQTRYANVHTSFAFDDRADVAFPNAIQAVIIEPRGESTWQTYMVPTALTPEPPENDALSGTAVATLPFRGERVRILSLRPAPCYLVESGDRARIIALVREDGVWKRTETECSPIDTIWMDSTCTNAALLTREDATGKRRLHLFPAGPAAIIEGYIAVDRVEFSVNGAHFVAAVREGTGPMAVSRPVLLHSVRTPQTNVVRSGRVERRAGGKQGVGRIELGVQDRIGEIAVSNSGYVGYVLVRDGVSTLVGSGAASGEYAEAWNLRHEGVALVANTLRDDSVFHVRMLVDRGRS